MPFADPAEDLRQPAHVGRGRRAADPPDHEVPRSRAVFEKAFGDGANFVVSTHVGITVTLGLNRRA